MSTGPSTLIDPYLVANEPNVSFTSLITVGDPLIGSTTGIFAGIPDGIGAYDNGDGTVTVIVNHELRDSLGVERDHGSIGSFIDLLVIDKATLEVVSGDDAMQNLYLWDDDTDSYYSGTDAFSRFCSGDLADATAFYNAASGLGSTARIYLTGEESGTEGRAVGTIVSGANTGDAYELPFLGNLAYENVTANPFAQDLTIVAATDDGSNGQVYIYIGEKQASGTEIEKAGLAGGAFYGIKVTGIADETNDVAANGTFTLNEIGPGGDVSNMTGAEIDAESEAEGVTSFLRPEDSAWDPDHPNVLYFTTTNSFSGNSRLYQATFTDITHPELGGTIVAVLDGSEGQHMFDNLTIANGKVILQEDPGGQDHIAQVWEYDIATDTLSSIAQFDPDQFMPGAPNYITNDEESSGVIDVTDIFGDATTRAYLLDAQIHENTGDPETVEPGQLLLMMVTTPEDGTDGDDIINGDWMANILSGFDGDDLMRGGSGDDVLYGNNGDDILEGWADDDTLYGGNGKDSLLGGDGDDWLVGGHGSDLLTGGEGEDSFAFSEHGFGKDIVTDFTHGEDTLVLGEHMRIGKEAHGDFNRDGEIDTQLVIKGGGKITLLGVSDISESDITYAAPHTASIHSVGDDIFSMMAMHASMPIF